MKEYLLIEIVTIHAWLFGFSVLKYVKKNLSTQNECEIRPVDAHYQFLQGFKFHFSLYNFNINLA